MRTGFRQAAPVVVAAAAIMFAVFAGFVPEGDATIKPIAFALAVGILADAVVVRMIAVPAALSLLGRAAWWLPRWLRWLRCWTSRAPPSSGATRRPPHRPRADALSHRPSPTFVESTLSALGTRVPRAERVFSTRDRGSRWGLQECSRVRWL